MIGPGHGRAGHTLLLCRYRHKDLRFWRCCPLTSRCHPFTSHPAPARGSALGTPELQLVPRWFAKTAGRLPAEENLIRR
jgi:hypothetical protein